MLSLALRNCAILAALVASISAKAADVNKPDQGLDIGEDAKLGNAEARDAGTQRALTNRIVGGNQADKGEYPYFVWWTRGCGASLIHDDIILTAAHCNGKNFRTDVIVSAYQMGVSDDGAQALTVVERVQHPNYNSRTNVNDYMVMRLNAPATGVTPIALNADNAIPADGDMLTTIGFGDLTYGGAMASFLQEVVVPYVPYTKCNKQYRGIIDQTTMLCAGFDEGGKDSCNGDSGGPIVQNVNGLDVHVGIVSWGDDCALAGKPGVYSRTSGQIEWILSTACRLTKTIPKPKFCKGISCVDDPKASFKISGKKRNCAWLSSRPAIQAQYCNWNSDPANFCPKTCNKCV